jgi:hypothetical protein
VDARVISEGAGFIGIVARLGLEYDRPAPQAPRSIVAKIPSPDPGSRQVGNLYGLYEREVRFYNHLAADSGVDTPACYFADYDSEAGQSLVLLEDLTGGEFGDQVGGCTLDDARLAITAAARFHAKWWQHPRIEEMPWMATGDQLVRGAMVTAFDDCVGPCIERFGHLLTPELTAAAPDLGNRILAVLDQFAGTPLTIAHGDYRLDNMFFGARGSARPLVVCDWQSPNRGWGTYDLAYFLAGGLDSPLRRTHEDELMRLYHRELTTAGVTGYSFDRLREDYISSLAVMMGIFVINGATLPTTSERGELVFEKMIGRFVTAITDLRALDALPPA